MKKLSILFAAFAIVFLASCGKYEEGPGFSLRSKTSRITGSWIIEKYAVDDIDYTSDVSGAFDFTEEGTFNRIEVYLGQTFTYSGNWELSSSKEFITLTYPLGGAYGSYKILRLTNTEFWFSRTDYGSTQEYRLRAK